MAPNHVFDGVERGAVAPRQALRRGARGAVVEKLVGTLVCEVSRRFTLLTVDDAAGCAKEGLSRLFILYASS